MRVSGQPRRRASGRERGGGGQRSSSPAAAGKGRRGAARPAIKAASGLGAARCSAAPAGPMRSAGGPGNGSEWRAAEGGGVGGPEPWSRAPNASGAGAGAGGDGRDEELAKLEIAVLALAFGAAVLGNGAVLLALRRSARPASRMHLFIRHLSLADLAVAFFQVLPQLCWDVTYRFRGPDGLCRVVKHLQVFGMFASAYVLVAMTADRYLAVCHPLRTLRQPARRSRGMVAAAWALSFVLSTPQYFIFSLSEVRSGVYDCWAHFITPWGSRAYVTWITGGIFVAPVLVLATCYGFICSRIWSNVRGKTRPPGPGARARAGAGVGFPCVSSVKSISRAKIRTVKMTFVIVSAYVVCWAPFFTIQMWSVWDQHFEWVGRCRAGAHPGSLQPTEGRGPPLPAPGDPQGWFWGGIGARRLPGAPLSNGLRGAADGALCSCWPLDEWCWVQDALGDGCPQVCCWKRGNRGKSARGKAPFCCPCWLGHCRGICQCKRLFSGSGNK